MALGAVALAFYSFLVCQLLMRVQCSALSAAAAASIVWLALALAFKQALLG